MQQGKFTLEDASLAFGLTKASTLNKLSKLKREGLVRVSGGGRQKRIYTISNKPFVETNGFYDVVNRYSPEKLVPGFQHVVHGKYTVEHAIIDGIKIGDVRTLQATKHLFNHVKNWTRLFELARKENIVEDVKTLYLSAREEMKVRKMPRKYL